MTKIVEFRDLAFLQAVRNDHLNPLIRKVENEIVPIVAKLEHDVSDSVKDVILTVDTNTLRFDKKDGGYKDIILTPILPKYKGLGVQTIQGSGPSEGVDIIKFVDATITQDVPGSAVVGFDWQEIFSHNQKYPEVVLNSAVSSLQSIIFTGDTTAVTTTGTNVTLKIPKVTPFVASIPGSGIRDTPISSIELEGESSSSTIADGKLTIHLSQGGGGGTITNQNFKGFFETLGDLTSQVSDPIHGKSFAYVKDQLLSGGYYTAYFYVNGGWTELKQDPALTYNAPSAATNQGVFSIKPSDKITLDSQGQLDLDGLSTPQLPQYFIGFYPSLEELKVQVPKPIPFQTCAYVRGPAGGWLNYRSDKQGTDSVWKVVAPLGSFSYVDEGSSSYTQVYGIRKSAGWTVDSHGLLSFTGGGGIGNGIDVGISDYNGSLETHDVKSMSFVRAKSMVDFVGDNKDSISFNHPQRVIQYSSAFEAAHNTQDYEGNIFYDENSRTWMGWSIPKDPGAVGAKWTRIAHEDMSLEVKDLVRRVPAKSASVLPGLIGDNPMWDHNGVTFIDQGSLHLPEEIQTTCGGYITTSVQDKDSPGISIPQYRIQTCTADRIEGGTWVRRFIATGSAGAAVSWSPWVRTSFSPKDIEDHSKDPNCHKSVMKYHRVDSLKGKISNLLSQELDNIKGSLRGGNRALVSDSYGQMSEELDYWDIPYNGEFSVSGIVEFSGFEGVRAPLGKWTVKVRVLRKDQSRAVDLFEFYHTHTDDKIRFVPFSFKSPKTELAIGDKLYVFLNFDNPTPLIRDHKELHLAPSRSYFTLEDGNSIAGSTSMNTFRDLMGRVDVTGDVSVKVHHNEYDTTKGIRLYGSKMIKDPVPMNKKP